MPDLSIGEHSRESIVKYNFTIDLIGGLLLVWGVHGIFTFFHSMLERHFELNLLAFLFLLVGKWLLERNEGGRQVSIFLSAIAMAVMLSITIGILIVFVTGGFSKGTSLAIYGNETGIRLSLAYLVLPFVILTFFITKYLYDFFSCEEVKNAFKTERRVNHWWIVIGLVVLPYAVGSMYNHYLFMKVASEVSYKRVEVQAVDADTGDALSGLVCIYDDPGENRWFQEERKVDYLYNAENKRNVIIGNWLGRKPMKMTVRVEGYKDVIIMVPETNSKMSFATVTLKMQKRK